MTHAEQTMIFLRVEMKHGVMGVVEWITFYVVKLESKTVTLYYGLVCKRFQNNPIILFYNKAEANTEKRFGLKMFRNCLYHPLHGQGGLSWAYSLYGRSVKQTNSKLFFWNWKASPAFLLSIRKTIHFIIYLTK